jgi:hypothetical protein
MAEGTAVKWYDKTWLVIVLWLIVFPVGLYGLWKSDVHSQGLKIGLTVVTVIVLIIDVVVFLMPTE